MPENIPEYAVPYTPAGWDSETALTARHWEAVPGLPAMQLPDGSGPARYQTGVQICFDMQALYIRFECVDEDIWGTMTERDQPIYQEEVVEVFLSPGADDAHLYYEFEVSPNGVLFDAEIDNPNWQRTGMEIRYEWDCEAIRWNAQRLDDDHIWFATLIIPWASMPGFQPLPDTLRANFYRIERPRGAPPEFSCWSPTRANPPDFHKPAKFGTLKLARPGQ